MNPLNKSLIIGGLFIYCFAVSLSTTAQNNEKRIIQFSGVVVTGDSLKPVPFTNITVTGTRHATVSDYYGFFSFAAEEGTDITFSAVGFKKAHFTIPDTCHENRYSMIQILFLDTVMLKEAVIYPWPTREQFRQAFLNLDNKNDDMARAQKNLAKEEMELISMNMGMSSQENYKMGMQQYQTRMYYTGGKPPLTLMDPLKWAEFVKAWKRGDFKSKD
ncbi:MAG: carboxypeptidase-like regulatory domain-containing protein [Bacteroidia bacterium]|nr:carboxypeptidase-like regulatory domain-containing protein [Bacteroidia bacterium]MCZ2249769.1 carboxypeptidase-like regulatory domain-containing protein [Bacteroidia bacterium]